MTHDDDPGEDVLAGIDLRRWQVPPPPSLPASSVLARALAPTTARRPRLGWIAGILIANAAIAAIIAIVIVRPASPPAVSVRPAGGETDAHVRELERQLDQQRREIDRRLAELQELRALVDHLAEELHAFQKRERITVTPQPTPAPELECDEVECVLENYEGACCAKYRRPPAAPRALPTTEALDRGAITNGLAAVRPRIDACRDHSTAKGTVKVKVTVRTDGRVASALVETTPDDVLGSCVAAAVKAATFARTERGGAFVYPFVF